jgi:hypothetical protein
MTQTLAELRKNLAEVKAKIREIGGPKGDYCKKCGSTDVFWMFGVFKKGDAVLFNNSAPGRHICIKDDFEAVPE